MKATNEWLWVSGNSDDTSSNSMRAPPKLQPLRWNSAITPRRSTITRSSLPVGRREEGEGGDRRHHRLAWHDAHTGPTTITMALHGFGCILRILSHQAQASCREPNRAKQNQRGFQLSISRAKRAASATAHHHRDPPAVAVQVLELNHRGGIRLCSTRGNGSRRTPGTSHR